MTTIVYPWEDTELLTADQAAEELAADADYDAWLAEQLADVELDPEPTNYVPFQDVPDDWGRGTFEEEIGYLESRCPYLF